MSGYNIEKSTEAACRYFKDAYATFGNWTLAAASYNVGIDDEETDRKTKNKFVLQSIPE